MLKVGPDSEPKVVLRPKTQKTDLGLPKGVGSGIRRLVLTYTLLYIDNQQGATV